ncbi:aspartate dehydrogenase [Phreatobacter aquaticus]|nr:aspartate dehydrogenase [Phreatobacter aquaticus]
MTADAARRGTRFGIIGFGRIGRRIAERLAGTQDAPELAGVLVSAERQQAVAGIVGEERVFTDPAVFLGLGLDVVVECASAAALAALGPAVLASGADLMPLSLAAFADHVVEQRLRTAAATGPGRLEIPAGAMGSIEFLAAAREDVLSAVTFRAAYPVERWRGSAAEAMTDLAGVTAPTTFLRTSVREAVRQFPRHINVAVGVALAGLGLDETTAELTADPAITQARFEVEAIAGPGPVYLRVDGRDAPLGSDPIDYTTFSLIRLLRRRQARIMI